MDKNTYKNLFRGVAWSTSMRWVLRAIGFLNVIILARLLTPEAFGIVVMATLVIGFTTNFTQMGIQQLIIREQNVDDDLINTGWTMLVLQALLIALLLVVSSPLMADYFDEERLPLVIFVLAVALVIESFSNIGITLARKDLEFSIDFKANVYRRLSAFFITLALVIWLRDYWALVLGRLFSAPVAVFFTYRLHPYRPRFCLSHFRLFLNYSYSIIPLRMAKFLNEKIGAIIVGGVSSAASLGIYNIAHDLASMFTREIAEPLGRGLMPGYAKMVDQPRKLAMTYIRVLAVGSAVVLPVGVGLCLVAEYMVPLLLGEQWLEAVVYVQYLSIFATLLSLQRMMSTQILIVTGHEARAAILAWIRLALLFAACLVAVSIQGPLGVAMVSPAVGFVLLPITVAFLVKSIDCSLAEVLWALWRPVLSVLVMAFALYEINAALELSMLPMLLLLVSAGGLAYGLSMALTWFLSGRPEGIEYLLERALRERLASR